MKGGDGILEIQKPRKQEPDFSPAPGLLDLLPHLLRLLCRGSFSGLGVRVLLLSYFWHSSPHQEFSAHYVAHKRLFTRRLIASPLTTSFSGPPQSG